MTTVASSNGVSVDAPNWMELSAQVRPQRQYDGAIPPPGDEAAEEHLRVVLARKVADMLDQRLDPGRGGRTSAAFTPAEVATIEALIEEEVTRYQLEQTSLGLPGLQDPAGAPPPAGRRWALAADWAETRAAGPSGAHPGHRRDLCRDRTGCSP